MHHSTLIRSLALASTLVVGASAADLGGPLNDLRFGIGFGPKYQPDIGSDDTDRATRVAVQYVRSVGETDHGNGFFLGGELGYDKASADFYDERTVQVLVLGGYAWGPADLDALHFEFGPFVGLGFSTLDPDSGLGSSDDDTDFLWGLRAAGLYTFDQGFQIGLDLRYQNQGNTFNGADVDHNGLVAMALLGYRF